MGENLCMGGENLCMGGGQVWAELTMKSQEAGDKWPPLPPSLK